MNETQMFEGDQIPLCECFSLGVGGVKLWEVQRPKARTGIHSGQTIVSRGEIQVGTMFAWRCTPTDRVTYLSQSDTNHVITVMTNMGAEIRVLE